MSADAAIDSATNASVPRLESPTILDFKGVSKTFIGRNGERHTAIKDVDFRIRDLPGVGEFRVFLGPSGCGKTTILRIVAGLETPTEGEATLYGKPIPPPGPDRGFVFQAYTSFPHMTVLDNVAFGLALKGVNRRERETEARWYIERVGLKGSEYKYPCELSGGMRQRVAIARSLILKPRILLMDEPFGALDVETRLSMQDLLNEIWQEIEATILFVTHDIQEAVYLADRIYLLSSHPGRVVEEIPIEFPEDRKPEIKKSAKFREHEEYVLRRIGELKEIKGQLRVTTE
jgi:ABC-type nitrate/sulfonate/bicarbonate transport system ATPase subunit